MIILKFRKLHKKIKTVLNYLKVSGMFKEKTILFFNFIKRFYDFVRYKSPEKRKTKTFFNFITEPTTFRVPGLRDTDDMDYLLIGVP